MRWMKMNDDTGKWEVVEDPTDTAPITQNLMVLLQEIIEKPSRWCKAIATRLLPQTPHGCFFALFAAVSDKRRFLFFPASSLPLPPRAQVPEYHADMISAAWRPYIHDYLHGGVTHGLLCFIGSQLSHNTFTDSFFLLRTVGQKSNVML